VAGSVSREQRESLRMLAEELLYAREYICEDERADAIAVWNIHYNYHRPHSAAGGRPPASRLETRSNHSSGTCWPASSMPSQW
jgi:transposase InsO family protein